MNRFFIFFIVLTVQSFASAQLVPVQTLFATAGPSLGSSSAGGDSFGGGDSVDLRKHTAWFYGNDSISTCFHVTENFGISKSEVKSQLESVVAEWKKYFLDKKINNISGSHNINTNFDIKENCEGGESLVLYFGTGPIFSNLLDLQARQSLSRPVAYVNKTHVSSDYTWSKGYIRFMGQEVYDLSSGTSFPDWNLNSSFKNLLKHELGHILGFNHVPSTIMDKGISQKQFLQENVEPAELKIDGDEELIACNDCLVSYSVVSSENPKWEKLDLKSTTKIELHIEGRKKLAGIQDVVYHQDIEPRLLSMFSPNQPEKNRPHVVFVKIEGVPYSLELEGKTIKVRSQGEVVAEFRKEMK